MTPIAAVAGAVALLLMLIGSYLDTPYKSGSPDWAITTEQYGLADLGLVVAFAAIGVALVFAVVVARGLRSEPDRTALRSLVVAVVGAVSCLVFWTGLPVILAAGAAVLALDARARLGRTPRTAAAALTLAPLITGFAGLLAFTG
jgi:heme/copper-type cytochrome/quinol oxidase subunit 2